MTILLARLMGALLIMLKVLTVSLRTSAFPCRPAAKPVQQRASLGKRPSGLPRSRFAQESAAGPSKHMEPDAWDHANDAAPEIDDYPGPDNGMLPKTLAHNSDRASSAGPNSIAKWFEACL